VSLCLLAAFLAAPAWAVEEEPARRVIKIVQPKAFLKTGHVEIEPCAAVMANDPFLRRYVAGLQLGWHLAEIFSVEADLGFSPDLGEADWKPVTEQLIEHNHVAPDLSRAIWFSGLGFALSPVHGKVAVARRIVHYDLFGVFGMGMVRTVDDLEIMGALEDPYALSTQHQLHPTTRYGGGARIYLGRSVALRLEARSLVYIETVSGTVLEMKNNLLLQAGVSFFVLAGQGE